MNDDFYIIYETTNLINGKKYRGIHKTSNINDGYIGSGYAFLNAVKKYGRGNFKREILEFCNSYNELIEKEKIYVDEKWVDDKNTYNIKTGGQSVGILSKESKNKISETLKRRHKNGEIISIGPNKGKTTPEEVKKKISNTLKQKYQKEEHPRKGKTKSSASWKKGNIPWNKGLKTGSHSEESNKKRSDTMKDWLKNHDHPRKGMKGQIPWNKERKWKKKKITEKIECPHCGKMMDISNGKRWHFENCKLKPPPLST